MKTANWELKNNEIFSNDFNDYYYNIKDPIKERLGIYVNNAFVDSQFVNILELGFGLGLNFLLTLKEAKERKIKVHYTAIENYYHKIEDLVFFANKFGLNVDEDFIKYYPLQKDGIARIELEYVTLDLVFMDVSKALDELNLKADVVFADGFSPSKNNEMFCKETFIKLRKLMKKDSLLLSYSSSSAFKKILNELGFEIQTINLGIKRESTKAILKEEDNESIHNYFAKNYINANNIAIIGGGVSAAFCAYELSKLGKNISVFEQNSTLANEGSGNKIGLLSALIQNPESELGNFSQFAYYESSKEYKKFGLELEGVFEHAFTDELKKRYSLQKNNPLFKFYNDFVFLKDGGSLEPYKAVPYVFSKSNAKIYLNHKLNSFKEFDDYVELFINDEVFKFDAVIFCTGAHSKDIFLNLPLSSVRGQVTWLKDEVKLKHPVSSKAYLTSARNGMRVLGASYHRNEIADARNSDDVYNLNNFKEYLHKDLSNLVIGSRVGYRSYSSDRFAIVGPYFNEDKFIKLYKSLQFTKDKNQAKAPSSRVFLSIAHGSRGLASSLVSARIIASYFSKQPSSVQKSFEYALHPARFLIRKLKKGLI